MSGRIGLDVADGIARILIDRPDKMNAILPEMVRELQRVCQAVNDDANVRVATIMGAGERAFSAGSDLNVLADLTDVMAFRDRIEYAALVRDIRKPVIAGLKGWVLGGGMEIAIAADIRVAGRSAKIGGPEVTRGWIGGGGASQMLPRLVGIGQAMKMLLTGDPVDADTALRIGLTKDCSRPATASNASKRRSTRSVRQSFASSTAALVRLPRYSSNLLSNFSNSVNASAVAPANPASTWS